MVGTFQIAPHNYKLSDPDLAILEMLLLKNCTLGPQKICVAQNSFKLIYLIGGGQNHQKTCSLRFSLHEFINLKLFRTHLENMHLQGLIIA